MTADPLYERKRAANSQPVFTSEQTLEHFDPVDPLDPLYLTNDANTISNTNSNTIAASSTSVRAACASAFSIS